MIARQTICVLCALGFLWVLSVGGAASERTQVQNKQYAENATGGTKTEKPTRAPSPLPPPSQPDVQPGVDIPLPGTNTNR
jgi:hypothetical protein